MVVRSVHLPPLDSLCQLQQETSWFQPQFWHLINAPTMSFHCCRWLILVIHPFTPHMTWFSHLHQLSHPLGLWPPVYENFDIQDGMSEFKSPYRAAPTPISIKSSLISTSPKESSYVTQDKSTWSHFPPLILPAHDAFSHGQRIYTAKLKKHSKKFTTCLPH